ITENEVLVSCGGVVTIFLLVVSDDENGRNDNTESRGRIFVLSSTIRLPRITLNKQRNIISVIWRIREFILYINSIRVRKNLQEKGRGAGDSLLVYCYISFLYEPTFLVDSIPDVDRECPTQGSLLEV